MYRHVEDSLHSGGPVEEGIFQCACYSDSAVSFRRGPGKAENRS